MTVLKIVLDWRHVLNIWSYEIPFEVNSSIILLRDGGPIFSQIILRFPLNFLSHQFPRPFKYSTHWLITRSDINQIFGGLMRKRSRGKLKILLLRRNVNSDVNESVQKTSWKICPNTQFIPFYIDMIVCISVIDQHFNCIYYAFFYLL